MELITGGTLKDLIEEISEKKKRDGRSMDIDLQRTILIDVAAGTAFLHESGLNHGDLKPANIVLDEHGHAKVNYISMSGFSRLLVPLSHQSLVSQKIIS